MAGAAAAEIECALAADVCAVFDAVEAPEKRLVTAQLHSAPPYFYLNPPTRQPAETPSATTTAAAAADVDAAAPAASAAPSESPPPRQTNAAQQS
ncbi:unnamed protein product [Hapterophycus canaliculatus]